MEHRTVPGAEDPRHSEAGLMDWLALAAWTILGLLAVGVMLIVMAAWEDDSEERTR